MPRLDEDTYWAFNMNYMSQLTNLTLENAPKRSEDELNPNVHEPPGVPTDQDGLAALGQAIDKV